KFLKSVKNNIFPLPLLSVSLGKKIKGILCKSDPPDTHRKEGIPHRLYFRLALPIGGNPKKIGIHDHRQIEQQQKNTSQISQGKALGTDRILLFGIGHIGKIGIVERQTCPKPYQSKEITKQAKINMLQGKPIKADTGERAQITKKTH